MSIKDCPSCKGTGWVCENHPNEVGHECPHCEGAAMLCEEHYNCPIHGLQDGPDCARC